LFENFSVAAGKYFAFSRSIGLAEFERHMTTRFSWTGDNA
jgi:hypothetical protein